MDDSSLFSCASPMAFDNPDSEGGQILKLKGVLFICVAAAIVVTACEAKPGPASIKPGATASTSVPSPEATPTSVASAVSPIPTPIAGQGVVTGVLIDQRTGQPATPTILYLEPAMNHDAPPLLYGPLNNQPRTTSLVDGQFVLTDVPPGEYILALYSPIDILFYQQPDGAAVLVQVKPGEVTDLEKVTTYIP